MIYNLKKIKTKTFIKKIFNNDPAMLPKNKRNVLLIKKTSNFVSNGRFLSKYTNLLLTVENRVLFVEKRLLTLLIFVQEHRFKFKLNVS